MLNELTHDQIRGTIEILDRMATEVRTTIDQLRAAGFSEHEQVPRSE